jgi:hypothetical protein
MSDDRKPAAFVRFVAGEPSPMLRQNSFVDLTLDDDDMTSPPSPVLTPSGVRDATNPPFGSPRQRAPLMVEELPNAFGWLYERMEMMEKRLADFESHEAVQPNRKKLKRDVLLLKSDQEKLQADFDKLKDDQDQLGVLVHDNEEQITVQKNHSMMQRCAIISQASRDRQAVEKYYSDVLAMKNGLSDLKDEINDLQMIKSQLLMDIDSIKDQVNAMVNKMGVASI